MLGKLILGLGGIAGGSLAVWRLTQEVVEARKLGPPSWWVLWMHPISGDAEPPPKSSDRLNATRVYRWDKDRWVPLSSILYDEEKTYVTATPPHDRAAYAQIRWTRKIIDDAWSVKSVRYASNVKEKLPR